MRDDGTALAEGFYWYAEKLMWGYEGTTKNAAEALRLYRQAAALGFSDAQIRIGELRRRQTVEPA
jgi:TPR repeat protein